MPADCFAVVCCRNHVTKGIFVWGYYRYFAATSDEKDSELKAERIELGDTVASRTASTKDSVSALPIVINSVFETSFMDQQASTTDDAEDSFGVTAIALSHRQSAFSLGGGAGEHANRKSMADWGFEADLDLDMPDVLVRKLEHAPESVRACTCACMFFDVPGTLCAHLNLFHGLVFFVSADTCYCALLEKSICQGED